MGNEPTISSGTPPFDLLFIQFTATPHQNRSTTLATSAAVTSSDSNQNRQSSSNA
jgi:hypothetical protein